jgi:3(or 17)beta-hydroxysteroid dehydrogenase
MVRVPGKVVIVTGGGSGIGRASAVALAREGARVVVADINEQGGSETARQIGGDSAFQRHDTTREDDWRHLVGDTVRRFGGLHGLVNNAGILGPYPNNLETETLEDWRRIQAVNVEGVILGCRAAMPVMRDSGGGSIVNLSSVAGLVGTPELFSYGASKGAVRQLTKSVAMHAARKGYKVRCNSVHPGIIMTPMGESLFDGDQAQERARAMVPVRELGRPEDIANGILFLISDESRYMTGAELVIDGGMTAL